MITGSTLVVVADGAQARFLYRPTPQARLLELVDLRMTKSRHEPDRDPAAHAFGRAGMGTHAIESEVTPHERAEEVFIAEVAGKTNALVERSAFHHLVVCAPPRALGAMRGGLSKKAGELLVLSVGKELGKETSAEIDARLRELHAQGF